MSDSFSRTATAEDLKALIRSLNDNAVEYLLIGGYALHAHGYQRARTDIDLMVPASRSHGARVKMALLVLPDQAAREIEPEWSREKDAADRAVLERALKEK